MKPDLTQAPFRHAQRGAVVIELALTCVLLTMLLLGTFVLGRAIWQYNVVAAAATQGARYMSAGPWSAQRVSDAEQLIVQMAAEGGVTGLTFDGPMCLPSSCGNSGSQMALLTVNVPFNDPTGWVYSEARVTTVQVTVPTFH